MTYVGIVMYPTVVCLQDHLRCPINTGNMMCLTTRKCAGLHGISYIFRTCAVLNHDHVYTTVLIPEIYGVCPAHVLCY